MGCLLNNSCPSLNADFVIFLLILLSEGQDFAKKKKLWEIFQAHLFLVLKRIPLKPKAKERLFRINIEECRQGEELFVPALSSGSRTNEQEAGHRCACAGSQKIPNHHKGLSQGRGQTDTK